MPDKDKPTLSPVQLACFGPGQRPNQTLIAAGIKMPCGYSVKADGRVDYWEEGVCDLAVRSNCYCYRCVGVWLGELGGSCAGRLHACVLVLRQPSNK